MEMPAKTRLEGGWIRLVRSADTWELVTDSKAFTLLAVVALRARWRGNFSAIGLALGEALIGDYEACGMTRGEYRAAVKRLQQWGLVTIKTTNHGTVAKLTSEAVFGVLPIDSNHPRDQRTTSKRPPNDHPTTTNEEGSHRYGGPSAISSTQAEANFVERWNELAGPILGKVRLTDGRRRKLKKRLGEEAFADPTKLIERILASKFLCGETSNFRASFDWVIGNDTNPVKIVEGNYDDTKHARGNGSQAASTSQPHDRRRMARGEEIDWDAERERYAAEDRARETRKQKLQTEPQATIATS